MNATPEPQTPPTPQPVAPSDTPQPVAPAPKLPAPRPYPKLDLFVQEIKSMEGWFVGSPSYTRNNPGNLRCPPLNVLASRCENNFCVFPDPTTGMKALRNVTVACATGQSATYNAAAQRLGLKSGADLNLIQYFTIRDPSSDGNAPTALAERFGRVLGVDPQTFTMRQLLV